MKKQVEGQLTLFPGDSPVSHSPLPGSAEARMMTVTSGQRCLESYENFSLLGSLVRMCLESSIWHSTKRLLIWKVKVTKSNASLFQLAVSMPRTKGNDLLLWPTPSTGAALCGGTHNFKHLQEFADAGIITEEERRNLSQGNGGKTNPEFLEWLMGYEQRFTDLIPTPTASDYRGGALSRYWTPQRERERDAGVRRIASQSDRGIAVWENWLPEPGVRRVAYGIPKRLHGGGLSEEEHSQESCATSGSDDGEMRNVRSDRSETEPAPYRLFKACGGNGSLHEMPCKGTFESSGYCRLCNLRENILPARSQKESKDMQPGMPCRVWSDLREQKMAHFWDGGEPNVPRVAKGVKNRVDRIKCLGNAVVPQQFYPFFYFIRRLMEEEQNAI